MSRSKIEKAVRHPLTNPLMILDGWRLIDIKKIRIDIISLNNAEPMVSVMWHRCDAINFEYTDADGDMTEVCFLDAEDSVKGKCWYCMEKIPEGLQTVWTIHNFNIIKELDLNNNHEAWKEPFLSERLEEIEKFKKQRREGGDNG